MTVREVRHMLEQLPEEQQDMDAAIPEAYSGQVVVGISERGSPNKKRIMCFEGGDER